MRCQVRQIIPFGMDSPNSIPHTTEGSEAGYLFATGRTGQAWRGRERRQGILPTAATEEEPASMKDRFSYSRRIRQLGAVLLKKVWDIDALKCPKCGGQMKSISVIEQSSVIMRILKHLDLWEDPRPPPQPPEMVCEPDADYIPWQDDVPEIEVG